MSLPWLQVQAGVFRTAVVSKPEKITLPNCTQFQAPHHFNSSGLGPQFRIMFGRSEQRFLPVLSGAGGYRGCDPRVRGGALVLQ